MPFADWSDETLRDTLARQGLPVPGKKRDAGALVDQRSEALLRRLVKLLRQSAGIPTRLPAHNTPPYRSEPIAFTAIINQAGAGAGAAGRTRFGVQWDAVDDTIGQYGPKNALRENGLAAFTTPQPFPESFLGVLTRVEVFAYQVSSVIQLDAVREARWSLLKNGAFVRGYQWQAPTSHPYLSILAAGAPAVNSDVDVRLACTSPIRLAPGDTVEVITGTDEINVAATITFVARVEGFMYPSKGADGTVYDTLVD